METLNAIVVGAGPAGSAAAYSLTKSGLQVMLVERAKTPGEKTFLAAFSMDKSSII